MISVRHLHLHKDQHVSATVIELSSDSVTSPFRRVLSSISISSIHFLFCLITPCGKFIKCPTPQSVVCLHCSVLSNSAKFSPHRNSLKRTSFSASCWAEVLGIPVVVWLWGILSPPTQHMFSGPQSLFASPSNCGQLKIHSSHERF